MDEAVGAWVRGQSHPVLTALLLAVTYAHNTIGLLAAGAVIGWLLWRRQQRAELATLVLALPGAMLLNVALKHLFQRQRPVLPDAVLFLDTYAFPSGHAAGTAVLYAFAALLAVRHLQHPAARVAAAACAVFMLLLVCWSRVYLGVHHPSDVLAGAAVGLLWLALCRATVRRVSTRER
jgi:membrane-associated phospholipid phosphatase